MSDNKTMSIRNISTLTVLFGIVLLCLVWIGLYYKIQSERQLEIDGAIKETSNYARTFEENTVHTVNGLDAIALFLKSQAEKEGLRIDLSRLVEEKRFEGQPFAVLGIVDEKGDLVASSSSSLVEINNSDLEFFQVHMETDSGKLFIAKPSQGRASGKNIIQMSRRINKPDGSFGGIVVVGVAPCYFTEFYKQVDLGAQSIIAIIGRDGILRVRQSGNEVSMGADFRNSDIMKKLTASNTGTIIAPSPVDGANRISSYRALKEYPLVVLVGVTEAYAFKDLNRRVADYYLICGAISVVVVVFVGLLLQGMARRKRVEDTLRESEEKYYHLFEMESDAIFLMDAQTGNILAANTAAVELYGYSREELLRLRSADLSAEPEEAESAGGIVKSGSVVLIPSRYHRKKDGTIFPVEIKTTALLWQGRPAFIPAIRDITERMQAEAVLRRTAEIQSVLREIAEEAILSHSLDDLYKNVALLIDKVLPAENFHLAMLDEANHQINVVFSVDKSNFIPRQRPMGKGLTEYALQQRRPVHVTKADIARLRETGEVTISFTAQIHEWLGAPLLDFSGKAIGVMVVVSRDEAQTFRQGDIEVLSIIAAQVSMAIERKQAEAAVRASQIRYHALMEQSFEALALVDCQTQEIVEVNRRFTEQLGYSLPEDAPLYAEKVIVASKSYLDRLYNETLPNQRILPLEAKTFRNKNGTEVPVERAGAIITLEGRDYLLCSFRDMTAERTRQAELARDAENAHRLQRSMLPVLPESASLDIQTLYRPANFISGDIYSLEWREDGKVLRGFLVDIAGHGLAIAFQTASFNVLLRESESVNLSLIEKMRWLNLRSQKYFTEGSYAAVIGFEVDLVQRELRYVAAGITHFYANGNKVVTPGMFVGLWDDADFTEGVIPVSEGDSYCFLTDGFTDILSQTENAEFSPQDGKGIDAHVEGLNKMLESCALRDDATVICLKIKALLPLAREMP